MVNMAIPKQPAARLQTFLVTAQRFSNVHVNLGPLLTSVEGSFHMLTITDHSKRWVEAIPLKIMEAFCSWLFGTFLCTVHEHIWLGCTVHFCDICRLASANG